MANYVTALLLGAIASPAAAVHFQVQNPCKAEPWLAVDVENALGKSVGEVTVESLDAAGIPFVGAESGIHSIRGSVSNNQAMEILGPNEMRAYGWCYRVNSIEPALYADEILISNKDDRILWFLGYAHYKAGKWVSMCEPTHLTLPPFICSNAADDPAGQNSL